MDIDEDNLDDLSDSDDDDISSSSTGDSDGDDHDDDDDEDAQNDMDENVIMNGPQGTWGEEDDDVDDDANYDDVDDEVLHSIDASFRQHIETNQVPQPWGEQGGHFTIEPGLEEPPSLITTNDLAAATGFLDSFSQDNMVGDISDVQVIDEDDMDEDEDDYDEEEEEGLIYHAGDDGRLRSEHFMFVNTKLFSDDEIDDWAVHMHPRHGRHRHPGPPFQGAMWRIGDPGTWAPGNNSASRSRQPRTQANNEGVNPLLRQEDRSIPRAVHIGGEIGQAPPWWPTRGELMELDGGDAMGLRSLTLGHPDFGMNFLNNLMHMIQRGNRFVPGDQIQLTIDGQMNGPGRAHVRATIGGTGNLFRHHNLHTHRHHHHHFVHSHDSMHTHRNDPAHATRFELLSTVARWSEEARMLFPNYYHEQASNVVNSILRQLVPPARQRQKEEEVRLQREKAETEERLRKEKEEQDRIAKEKKEREEQEAKERAEREAQEAAEAAQAAEAAGTPEAETSEQTGDAMEGVESLQPEPAAEPSGAAGPSNAAPPTERVMYRLGDSEIDITSLGIDPAFLDEIPEDMREEVLMGQVVQQRANAASTGDENTDYDQEFLAALPPDMREELIQAEIVERRRREREDARRNARANAESRGPSDMDNASFFASLSTTLREQVLAEQDEATLATLPPDLAAEARRLGAGRQRMPTEPHRQGFVNPRVIYHDGSAPPAQSRPRQFVQILDKAGVAALLRLMFMAQSTSAKQSLYDILYHACQNKQNRADILSTLLSILQDGSSDSGSVERSFAQLSSRAKPSSSGKTPQKRPGTSVSPEMTPLTIMDQCLNALCSLIQNHGKVMEFMLSEHEVSIGFKSRSARKGKAKETKASRYPINALLGLLDRKSITENSVVMESLTAVLQYMTSALATWDKKRKEIEAKEKEAAEKAKTEEQQPSTEAGDATGEQEQAPTEQPAEGQPTEPSATATEPAEKTKKPKLPPAPPEVSEHNLRLVVSIFAARECTSKTFKSTLYLISNLATIPKVKPIFAEELMRLAQSLGSNILDELTQLLTQVKNAQSATDVLRVALSKFSPANSDQAKLLRVVTCLDYLFQSSDIQLREMFESDTFSQLWTVLSQCLTAIREQGNMMNVATILLPLIEVLMVVCRSSAIKANDQSTQQLQSQSIEMSISSLREESPMESLFFKFTDEHKKILNDLVRQSPKLMSGSFSLLVKNSKILEFDNKREHFGRKLKAKSPNDQHQAYAQLTVNVKRDDIFRDSYRALFFKKPNEIKYGKLNVKFIGEEAVDAGGVTREWFHELVKQIFNPNYVLFLHIASDRTTFHPNESSSINPEHLSWFKFVGNIIGKAVFESRHLDCHFSQAVYKRILGKPVGVKDMEAHDPAYYKSLVWILENDVSEQEMTFSREYDEFGVTKIVDLIENGQNVKVTNENKREYVSLIVHNLLVAAVEQQLDKLIQGKSTTLSFRRRD
jgi:E3 ubiquitin-protein ligase HUWE1